MAPIGDVVKYIIQRDRTIISNFSESASSMSFEFARLPISSTVQRDFEATIKPTDVVTMQVDLTGVPFIGGVTVAGNAVPFEVRGAPGSRQLYFSAPVTAAAQTAQITITQEAPPELSVAPNQLEFSVVEGGVVPAQVLGIANAGGGELTWTVSDDAAWLAVSPVSGSGAGNVDVSVDAAGLAVGSYAGTVTVVAPGAVGSPRAIPVTLTVLPVGAERFVFDYPDRAALLADGWDFQARTAGGVARNTEQTPPQATVVYRAAGMQIPADVGDLWAGSNSTRNSVFRDLPAGWTSAQARVSFAPTQNYQQSGIVLYGDDDNYVGVYRIYTGGQRMVMATEQNGVATLAGDVASTATTNMWMRLVRDPATNVVTGSYSLDGSTWVTLGTVTRTITNPRLGIVAGASPSGFPLATIHEVQIIGDRHRRHRCSR